MLFGEWSLASQATSSSNLIYMKKKKNHSMQFTPASDSTSIGIPFASTQHAFASASTRHDSLSATTASNYYGRSWYSSQAGPSSILLSSKMSSVDNGMCHYTN